jgi:hypothetical protein
MTAQQNRGAVTGLKVDEEGNIELRVIYPDGSSKWSRKFVPSEIRSLDWSDEANPPTNLDWKLNPAVLVTARDGAQSRVCPHHTTDPC